MKTPNFGTVTVSKPSRKKAKFTLSHDVNTSYDWGSVQPLFSKLMIPDSSVNINLEQLTRLAPMVVPTFGRVKMKNVAHFVSIKDIFPNWDYFLSKQQISRPGPNGVVTFVPNTLPHINSSILTSFALAGAKVSWYVSGATNNPGINNVNTWRQYKNTGNWSSITGDQAAITAGRVLLAHLLSMTNSDTASTWLDGALGYSGPFFNVRRLTHGTETGGVAMKGGLTIGNNDYLTDIPTISTVYPNQLNGINTMTFSANGERDPYDSTKPIETVTMEGADLIWESDMITSALRADATSIWNGMNTTFFDGCKIRLCFRLSSFGKRLRKVLIGLGYNFSLSDDSEVSLLPLLAYYKAYWDSYAPERLRNFYMTPAWKLIQFFEDHNVNCAFTGILNNTNVQGQFDDIRFTFKQFMGDLGTCFATEAINAISAATEDMVLETAGAGSQGIYDIIQSVLADYSQNYVNPADMVPGQEQSIPKLGSMSGYARLAQPMLDTLKIAWTYVNKYSVAGKQIEEILRMNGLGAYVDECKGKFIAADESTIKISDVVATAATDESSLGQYGGRGIGFGQGQMSFSTDRHGYFILLSAIVPEAGYVNSPDMTNEAVSFGDFYNPEFDGLNYEAVEKKQIVGSTLVNVKGDTTANTTFGFLPTYSNWKFMSNKANGDFSLNSQRNSVTPYTLDKYIPVNDVAVLNVVPDSQIPDNLTYTAVAPLFEYSDLPNAGEDYRYINKMAWNGNFNRIFKAEDDGVDWVDFSRNNNSYLFNSFEYDNFLTHNVFDIAYWAPMKAIEDSYSTHDEEDKEATGGVRRS